MTDPAIRTALPPPGEVSVWWWRLDGGDDEVRLLRTLISPDERARADRFVKPLDGTRFTMARGRLRQLLARHIGLPPEDLAFEASPAGKPHLAIASRALAPGLRFNLSHSGGVAAVVLADAVEVGIDIEAVRPVERDVAARFFAPEEVATLEALPATDWLAGFYRCWTRKEAVLKASGHGLGVPLHDFAVSLEVDGPARVLRARGLVAGARAWPLLPFAIASDLPGAVVVASEAPHRIAWLGPFGS